MEELSVVVVLDRSIGSGWVSTVVQDEKDKTVAVVIADNVMIFIIMFFEWPAELLRFLSGTNQDYVIMEGVLWGFSLPRSTDDSRWNQERLQWCGRRVRPHGE